MIILDYRDRRPLYEQITGRFQELIVKGILPKDTQMPSVRSQAMQLSINPNTIQRAYSQLEREGYIYTIKGRGSFVADISGLLGERREEWKRQFIALAEEGELLGISRQEMRELLLPEEPAEAGDRAGKPMGVRDRAKDPMGVQDRAKDPEDIRDRAKELAKKESEMEEKGGDGSD